ncbi:MULTISPECIES: ribosome biogenesis GTP-binding protein YihA/YsxC [unclassified Geobacillus]|uniref:ribosome biogenesis GTP-binding protein YihA/YsxC n=1 Tax=unclassified Geobacillus TaxID=2642459 RepID=UPI000BE28603|nr:MULTISPECIES: ribosome biogenesis GTP-binding protein YihA/YsxC [unclassified Geobacillus]PDM41518.1 YihA family ribosome biogenesis GTP-binding protein [Parageobacillus yumthangensis]RDV23575.1 YihA family ribosome biogenesis GTP-binding protein [Parageobacillus toebii]TXK92271.1 YihA family ribosome biogenesis GTP-binding protein [Parageobacillus sp. SY1]PUF89987.1 YihA family ribosome biogenesis GTP-binding protein [Geobacillus sp. LYN3]TXK88403.1 YihA family ribosome biogenesis GTP-bind
MNVTKAEIAVSAVKPEQYPDGALPEFALAGRSNVGKSSFINKMINRKNLARTSSKPGKTQTLNFYLINESLYFVDVPGYGFARVSKKEREAWGKMMETYFTTREQLRAVVLIVDLRHPPTKDDVMMYEFLKHYQIPTIIIATKADKVPKGKWQKHLKVVRETLNIIEDDKLILFSAETGQGKEEAWAALERFL